MHTVIEQSLEVVSKLYKKGGDNKTGDGELRGIRDYVFSKIKTGIVEGIL